MIDSLKAFLRLESAGGILLVIATVLALLFANSPLAGLYDTFLALPLEVRVAEFQIAKPLLLWINDGLMAMFFFLVGLELKRELLEGELSSPDRLILPVVAAIGGMAVPAAIYVAFNWGDSQAMSGWAIPAATDIAFALGVLSLLGTRVPAALKVFLVSLAIIDDIGAIVIIALFYTSDLSMISLIVAAVCVILLSIINRRGVVDLPPYLLIGLVLWASVLKSGVHATLAGVVLAFFIPFRIPNERGHSPARELEHDLHPSVAFVILPLFAFANAGVALDARAMQEIFTSVPMGIAAGLFVGKQLGVFGCAWLAVKLRLAPTPTLRWSEVYGAALLCGIGFTMSLFIGSLAFGQSGSNQLYADRLGILLGSFLSALAGYFYLNAVLPRQSARR